MNILFGTDGSEVARLAESLLVKLARGTGANILVVSVLTPPVLAAPVPQAAAVNSYASDLAQIYDQLKEHTRRVAHEAEARLKAKGFSVKVILREGDPGNELLEVADEVHPNWIVVGSRGDNALTAMLLGSVARKLVSRANCSVLIAHPGPDQAPADAMASLDSKKGLRALVGIENSEASAGLIETIQSFGDKTFSHIDVVCAEPSVILPPSLEPVLYLPPSMTDLTFAQSAADSAAELLKSSAPEVGAQAISGRPATVLIESAKEHESDVIFLTAKRHGTLERILIGSVSYEVAHAAPCSVFVHRPQA